MSSIDVLAILRLFQHQKKSQFLKGFDELRPLTSSSSVMADIVTQQELHAKS